MQAADLQNAVVIFVIVLAALGLYKLRRRRRLLYGVIEVLVAVVFIVLAFYPQSSGGNVLTDASPSSSTVIGVLISRLISLSAGVYIFVRGLDNIDNGKDSMPPTIRSLWERWI
jgi:drug/metabolite transporter (DMT)-like permease